MKKHVWKISGHKLKDIYIVASSFDEALEKAREVNKHYCTGQIVKMSKR